MRREKRNPSSKVENTVSIDESKLAVWGEQHRLHLTYANTPLILQTISNAEACRKQCQVVLLRDSMNFPCEDIILPFVGGVVTDIPNVTWCHKRQIGVAVTTAHPLDFSQAEKFCAHYFPQAARFFAEDADEGCFYVLTAGRGGVSLYSSIEGIGYVDVDLGARQDDQ